MRDITLCHPRLQALTAQLVDKCVGAGLPIKIGESFRSVAEQDALYAQGRTQPGSIVTNARGSSYSSQHQWGIAADFYRADGKGAYNKSGDYFKKVGELCQTIWGWMGRRLKSIVDKPHVYLPRLGQRYWDFETEIGGTLRRLKRLGGGEQHGTRTVKTVLTDLKEIKSGIRGVESHCVLTLSYEQLQKVQTQASATPKDQRVQQINKCCRRRSVDRTADGWVSRQVSYWLELLRGRALLVVSAEWVHLLARYSLPD